jgi:hypothetical protein
VDENFQANAVVPDQSMQQDNNIGQKMLSQEQVNQIVAREKSRAAESTRRELEEKHRQEMETLAAQRGQQQQRNAEVSKDVDADAIYQQVQDRWNKEMKELQLKEQMAQVANNYMAKVDQAKKSYEDFEEVTKDFDPTSFPQVTYLVSGLENGGDIIYELSKNPSKLTNIALLAERSPRMAQTELMKLGKSISDNRQAQDDAKSQTVSEPLSRLTPSRVAGSNGDMSISDLRNLPWLRG